MLFYANFSGKFEDNENPGIGLLVRGVGAETVARLGYGFITPFVIIVIAAKVAPKYKVATGRVIALLLVVQMGYMSVASSEYNSVDYFRAAVGRAKLYPVVLHALQVTGIYAALRYNNRTK